MLQFTAAEPLASWEIVADNEMPAVPAVTVCASFSPLGNPSDSALMLSARLADAEVFATEVALMLTEQPAFSAASAGGVYVAVMPELENVPQPVEGLNAQVTPALEALLATVAVRVTAEAPASTEVDEPLCAMETLGELPALEEECPPQFVRVDNHKQPRMTLTKLNFDLIESSP
jgi:hypothetical protein